MPVSPLITKGLEIAEKRLGMEELAKRMHTTDSLIRAWRMGHATMPDYKFLRLVDILNELEPIGQRTPSLRTGLVVSTLPFGLSSLSSALSNASTL